jgi:hypothetical protein
MDQSNTLTEEWTLADGHVHIHDCFVVGQLLDSALRNFEQAGREIDATLPCNMLLLLTESSGVDMFGKLRMSATARESDGSLGQWSISSTEESCSLNAQRASDEQISIIAGRQIVTREKLEVLALCTDAEFPDGEPIEATLHRIADSGALIVLPWGFGKWIGERGRIIRRLLASSDVPAFHIGDNSGRLRYWPTPPEFSTAARQGMRLIPGTDPLPFPEEATRVGRYGFGLPGQISGVHPAADLIGQLSDPTSRLVPFGSGERIFRFIRNQLAMQLAKRQRSKAPGTASRSADIT